MIRFLIIIASVIALVPAAEPVLVQSDRQQATFVLESVEPAIGSVATAAGSFATVTLDRAGVDGVPGAPQLPVYRRLIEVPYGARLSVETTTGVVVERALGQPLYPAQPSVPKSGPAPAFAYDAKSYREPGPEIGATVSEAGIVRGHRLALVEIRPASYAAQANVLRYCPDMRVTVRFAGADWNRTRASRQRYDSPAFRGRLKGVAANYPALNDDPPPDLPVGYLIIVPDAWQASVQPLADWRRRRGLSVSVCNLTQVGGGQANTVRNFLQDAYDNWPIPPSYVLLVGDVDKIGCFTGQGTGSPPTDLNYSMLEGSDYLPDIDLSRASVASAAQLDSLVAKIVSYEQVAGSGGTEWLKKAYFIASSDGGNHQTAEGTHRYVMAKLRSKGTVCDSIWLYSGQGTPITTAINGGRSWVTYSGHGDYDCWADPNFDLSDVHALANTDMVPYVQTFACLSGDFSSSSYPECFSEAWIRNGKRGAIAHMASSVTSYWTEDDTLERRVFDCMFDSSFRWIMGGYNRAKLIYFAQMGNTGMTRRYLEMYNLMGDGAVDVYGLEPRELLVQYPPVIPLGAYPLNVTVTAGGNPVKDALVCAAGKNDTTVLVAGYTDAAGEVTLDLLTVAPDSVYLTVTGHDLEPHLGALLALPSSGPYVMYLRHTVDDSAGGNNDHIINPGEAINLPVWVKNWGSAQAQNVRTWLRTADPSITLLDTLKSFGNIGAGDSAYTGEDGFGFSVAAGCTNGYALKFTLTTRDANDSVWTTPLSLAVGAPVLDYSGWRADDPPPGGNRNGMIEPGENGELIVTLRNTGMGHAYGVSATLRSGDARLSVLDSLGGFGTILYNDGDRFRVTANSSIPRETQVPCTLLIAVGATVTRRDFVLPIGLVRAVDPIPDGPRTPARYYAYDSADTLYTEAPDFDWIEISGVGTRLTLGDDQTVTQNLPSTFGPWKFYGQRFSQVSICSNGWISPGATSYTYWTNYELPYPSAPPMVAMNWDDYDPRDGGGVWYCHDTTRHCFIVEFDSVHYVSPSEQWDKFQVLLYDTTLAAPTGDNVAVCQYQTANSYSSTTAGIQDPTKAIAIQCLYNGTYHRGASPITAGSAIKYTTVPPEVGISEPGAERTAGRLVLWSAAPNPFRRATQLAFSLPKAGSAALSVYDPSGRRVTELVRGTLGAGVHRVAWDGTDRDGRTLGYGVYLGRLETDWGTTPQKLVLAR